MDILKNLYNISSVAGYENEMKDFIKKEIEKYCENIDEDNFGNLIATVGKGKETVLVNTTLSEEGLFVTSAKEGKIKVSPIGTIKPFDILHGRFSDGVNTGVVSAKEKKEEYDISDIALDFFDNNPECGTILHPVCEYLRNGNYIVGKSSGVKICVYILISIIKRIKPVDLTYKFVFSVEDNLGFKGAKVAFKNINPDRGYVISLASDTNKHTGIFLGKGPCVRLMDKTIVFSKSTIDNLLKKISLDVYQKEIAPSEILSNNRAQYLNNGIPVLNINLPVRYKNTFSETVHMDDAERIIKAFL